MQFRIMYIESKDDIRCDVHGGAWITRVQFSKTGKTLYALGRAFQSLKGHGYKANYFDVNSGERFWISGCRKDGRDSLYAAAIEVDEEVREEYWRTIRERPHRVHETSFRSDGKHTTSGRRGEGRDGAEVPENRGR